MARLKLKIGNWGIYELDEKECEQNWRFYPTYCTWDWRYPETVGNMYATENESATLEDAIKWCKKNK